MTASFSFAHYAIDLGIGWSYTNCSVVEKMESSQPLLSGGLMISIGTWNIINIKNGSSRWRIACNKTTYFSAKCMCDGMYTDPFERGRKLQEIEARHERMNADIERAAIKLGL